MNNKSNKDRISIVFHAIEFYVNIGNDEDAVPALMVPREIKKDYSFTVLSDSFKGENELVKLIKLGEEAIHEILMERNSFYEMMHPHIYYFHCTIDGEEMFYDERKGKDNP